MLLFFCLFFFCLFKLLFFFLFGHTSVVRSTLREPKLASLPLQLESSIIALTVFVVATNMKKFSGSCIHFDIGVGFPGNVAYRFTELLDASITQPGRHCYHS